MNKEKKIITRKNLTPKELEDIKDFSETETTKYFSMRNSCFTHNGAKWEILIGRTSLHKFYDTMTGCINIPKSLFNGDILTESIAFITNMHQTFSDKGFALEYIADEMDFEINGEWKMETFYSIREVEPWN